jgi:hypothetical protein
VFKMERPQDIIFLSSLNNDELVRLQQKELAIVKEINRLSDVSESVTDRLTLALRRLPDQGKQLDEHGMFIPWDVSVRPKLLMETERLDVPNKSK